MEMDISGQLTTEDIFAAFPSPCFPDVEDMELRIDEEKKALRIRGTDSEWPLEGDLLLAAGPGCMSFFYAGEPRFQLEGPEGIRNIDMSEARQAGLPQAKGIRFIERGQPWEFIFSIGGQKTLKILAGITAISWEPSEESATPDAPSAILDELGVITWKNGVLLKLCCDVVLYSIDLNPPEQKEALLRIFDDYTALYGSRLRWTTNPKTGSFKKLSNGLDSYAVPGDWLLRTPQKRGFEFLYHGGERNTDASDLVFLAMGDPDYGVAAHDLSMVCCRFPLADVLEKRIDMVTLLCRWGSLLKPHHGRCGISLGKSFGYEDLTETKEKETEALLRFPGLQAVNILEGLYFKDGGGLYDGPRCPDWLLPLADTFVEKLGGIEELKRRMAPFPVHAYEGGALLQAGEFPCLGGPDQAQELEGYYHMGKVIEPIRWKNATAYLYSEQPYFGLDYDRSLGRRWAERFAPKS